MILALVILIGLNIDINLAFAKKSDSKSKNTLQLCCTWGDSLKDGILTFSIKNGGTYLTTIVKSAFQDWENLFDGDLKFKYKKDEIGADIKIEFKKGKGLKVGKTVTNFDKGGFIKFVEISISRNSHNVKLNGPITEHIVKHELGHALGLGHANFKNTLMSPKIEKVITKVSACELASVKYVNHWKFFDNSDSPVHLQKNIFNCKKNS